jgi:hypothetical protein
MSDEPKDPTPIHAVPPPPGETRDRPADVRQLRPPPPKPPPPPETLQLLRTMVEHIRLLRGELARVRAESQDTSLALAQIVEDYMKRHGEQLDAHTAALKYLVEKEMERKP